MRAWPNWHTWLLAPVIGGLLCMYAIALRAPAVGTFHDDGVYLVTAKALATGQGYRIMSLPSRIYQTKYPPLFPAMLAAVWRLAPRFPDNVTLLKCVPLAGALVWFALAYLLLRRENATAGAATLCVLLTAASPWVLFTSTALLSETWFAAFATGSLLLLRLTPSRRQTLASAALASAAYLTRTAGVALIGAGILVLLLGKRPRHAAIFTLVCAMLCGPWVLWQHSHPSVATTDAYYSSENYESWHVLHNFKWPEKATIVGKNLAWLMGNPAALLGVKPSPPGILLALLFCVLITVGCWRSLRAGVTPVHLFLAAYGALLVLWAWPPIRFLIPLLPLLLHYAHRGLAAFCPRPVIACAAAAVAFCFCGASLLEQRSQARQFAAIGLPQHPPDDWRAMRRTLDTVAQKTSPGAVIMANLDPVVYLYTSRPAVRGFVQNPYLLHYAADEQAKPLGDAAALARTLASQHVNYVLQTPDALYREGPFLKSLVSDFSQLHPGALLPLSKGEGSSLLQVIPPATLRVQPDLTAQPRMVNSN